MEIEEFIKNFKTHPVLFIGSGFSQRYLKKAFGWEQLLKTIADDFSENEEYFLDLKSRSEVNGRFQMENIATQLEFDFNSTLSNDRNGKFKYINDIFYDKMKCGQNISRFKIYISELLKPLEINDEKQTEIKELKKSRKNISAIITTNYDKLIEKIFEFNPVIGNNILLSTIYGSLYKIHGCIDTPQSLIITQEDYEKFEKKYELIRAQLLSFFIYHPIIFLGYSLEDKNIKNILKTIFTYVDEKTEQAEKIRKNFLLIEYDKGNLNTNVVEHDIDIQDLETIRINKLKTDNFLSVYKAISNLRLPISAMDVRKVETIVQEIYTNGKIKVKIAGDLDDLKNSENILAIGNINSINYKYTNTTEYLFNYFKILEEENIQLLEIIEQINISKNQYFPIYEFSKLIPTSAKINNLKENQKNKIEDKFKNISTIFTKPFMKVLTKKYNTIEEIQNDDDIALTNKPKTIFYNVYQGNISPKNLKLYLLNTQDKSSTDYRMLLCLYDYIINK